MASLPSLRPLGVLSLALAAALLTLALAGFPAEAQEVPLPAESPDEALVPTAGPDYGFEAKLTAPQPKVENYFGNTVAIEGDILAVTAPWERVRPFDEGSVHIFERSPGGWNHIQKIVAPDIEDVRTHFGQTLAMSEDTLLIGDYVQETGGSDRAGAVYFYDREGGTFEFEKKVSGRNYSDNYGWNIAVDGDRALIGALPIYPLDSHDNEETLVYSRINGTWEKTAVLDPGSRTSDSSLAVSGDTILISRYKKGEAYIYERTQGTWKRTAVLEDPTPGGGFGWVSDFDGNQVIVAEFWGDQVHVFQRYSSGWSLESTFSGPEGASESFGRDVDIHGDLAFVGAPGEEMLGWQVPDVGGTNSGESGLGGKAGAVYVYREMSDGWSYQGRLVAPDAGSGDFFGDTVDSHGDSIVVSAASDDHGPKAVSSLDFLGIRGSAGRADHGSAYVFSTDGDNDYLADRAEPWHSSDPSDPDTDGDRVDDGTEVTCGWGADDSSSPVPAGQLTASGPAPPVPVGEHRWWLCGMGGS